MITFPYVKVNEIFLLQQLAHQIWYEYYPSIISKEQISFMLEMMYSFSVINREIQEGFHWKFIQLYEEKIGFLSYNYEKDSFLVKLNKLYILPKYHGNGFGQLSLQHVIKEAQNYKAISVYLTVNKNNIQAINAYKKAGFIIEKSEKFDLGNGFFMDDYVMKCNIKL